MTEPHTFPDAVAALAWLRAQPHPTYGQAPLFWFGCQACRTVSISSEASGVCPQCGAAPVRGGY